MWTRPPSADPSSIRRLDGGSSRCSRRTLSCTNSLETFGKLASSSTPTPGEIRRVAGKPLEFRGETVSIRDWLGVSPRPLLLGIHIPKTAGTSLREALGLSKIGRRIAYIYGEPPGIPVQRFIADFQSARLSKRVIFGHYHFGLHERLGVPARYFTVLRHPLARALSLYRHFRRVKHSTCHRLAMERGIEGLFDPADGLRSRYSMTRILANAGQGFDALEDGSGKPGYLDDYQTTEQMLAVAKRNLTDHFDFVGISDYLEADRPELEKLIGASLTLPRENVDPTPVRAGDLTRREIRSIERVYEHDFELYNFALRLREKP